MRHTRHLDPGTGVGRDVWYNEYNSRTVEPDPDAVAEAVAFFVENPRDPEKIIKMHIDQAEVFRKRFVNAFGVMLKRHDVTDVDANAYFRRKFTPKMRGSMKHDAIVKIIRRL